MSLPLMSLNPTVYLGNSKMTKWPTVRKDLATITKKKKKKKTINF